jgi:probable HAF family extracellular repeat protein
MRALDPDADTVAAAVSGDGSTVVGLFSQDAYPYASGFRWTEGGGLVHFWGLLKANGVSDDASTIVGRCNRVDGTGSEACLAAGDLVRLGDVPDGSGRISNFGEAHDVSGDGSRVVGTDRVYAGVNPHDPWHVEAFLWSAPNGTIGLGSLGAVSWDSVARAISADGSTVVGFSETEHERCYPFRCREAFRWTEAEGMVALGSSAHVSEALDVSADGSVVVGTDSEGGAFVWDAEHGIRSLSGELSDRHGIDLSDWTLLSATGVSAEGCTVVGDGLHGSESEAWIATLPKPSRLARCWR